MRRALLTGSALLLAGLAAWVLWPDPDEGPAPELAPAPAVPEALQVASRPPVAGGRCAVRGFVTGGLAEQVTVHSVRAGLDLPARITGGGRGFDAMLPEQGPVEVAAQASDGRSASIRGVCDGSGVLELRLRLPEVAAEPSVAGRCLYLETGVPVSAARVLVRWADDELRPGFSGLTDDEGRFAVAAPAGMFRVRCGKDGDESEAARITVEPGVPARLELFLAARAGVAGTVRDRAGPVAGVRVRGRPAREGVRGREAEAHTDLEGRYLLMGIKPGPVLVEVQDNGRFAEGQGVARVDLPYAEVDLELRDAAVIVEGVVSGDGADLSLATVQVTAVAGRRGRPRVRTRRQVRVAADGSYAVGGVALGRVRVEASAPGRVSSRAEVTAVPGRTRVDLRLDAACETQIQVGPAEPSRPVFVRVHREGHPDVRASGRTGAPIVVQSAPGSAEVYVRSVGQRVATATRAVELCGSPVSLELGQRPGRGALEVSAVGPDGAPVAGVRVWVNTAGGLAVTPEDGTVRFEDLEPGAYRVGTRDADPVQVEVRADDLVRVELRVARKEGEVTGEVVAGGGAVEGAAILAACADSGRPPGMSSARVRARSDGAGAFSFVPDDGGICLVRAEHRSEGRSDPVLLRAGGDPGRIELLGAAQVAGRVVHADGRPVKRYTLRVRSLGAAADVEGRTLQIRDPTGAFSVPDLVPGRVALLASSPSGRARTELELAPGDRREGVELTIFRQGKVVGRVVDEEGVPIAGARVRIEASRRPLGRSRTGADGAFAFSVPAGDPLRVFASAKGFYPRGTEAFDVGADGPTDLGHITLEAEGDPEDKEGGIGIVFGGEAEGIRIIRFAEESPAREAGLMVGDLITAIDGVPFGRDPLVNWVVTLRGVAGTPVVLQIQRGTDHPFTATVVRRAIGLPAMPTHAP